MTLPPPLNTQCLGKVAYDSPRLAHTVSSRKNGIKRREVYRCKACGYYHLGTPNGVLARRRGFRESGE